MGIGPVNLFDESKRVLKDVNEARPAGSGPLNLFLSTAVEL